MSFALYRRRAQEINISWRELRDTQIIVGTQVPRLFMTEDKRQDVDILEKVWSRQTS